MSDLTNQYIIAQEEHDYNKKYEKGTIVKYTINNVTIAYTAKQNVPQFVSVLNENYWKKIASTDEGGTADYDNLKNKPSINGVELEGNITNKDLGIDNKFKGWYPSSNKLPTNPVVGDYAYVKGAESTDPAAIYECTTDGSWSDSGRTADTSNVQTFASGEEVNEISIDNDFAGGSGKVAGAEEVKNLASVVNGESGYSEVEETIQSSKYYRYESSIGKISVETSGSSFFSCVRIPCVGGDKFKLYGTGYSSSVMSLYVFSDDTITQESEKDYYNAILSSGGGVEADGLEITAPEGSVYLNINFYQYDSLTDKVLKYSKISNGLLDEIKFKDGQTPSQKSVVDNLNSDSQTDVLSAKQGKVLDGKISDQHQDIVNTNEKLGDISYTKVPHQIMTLNVGYINGATGAIVDDNQSYNLVYKNYEVELGDCNNVEFLGVILKSPAAPGYSIGHYNDNLWVNDKSSYYAQDSSLVYPESHDYKVEVPEGATHLRACILATSVDDAYCNTISGETVKDMINSISGKNTDIVIRKVNSDNFVLLVPNEYGDVLAHTFTHNSYTKDLTYGGDVVTTKCGDVWNASFIQRNNTTIIQGNINFIYCIANELGNDQNSPFYGENAYTGSLHGAEITNYIKFIADGVEIDINELTEDLHCKTFRIINKSFVYAIDTNQTDQGGGKACCKLDSNGDKILTAIHTYDALYKVGNRIYIDNNITFKRNGIKFQTIFGAMAQGWYPAFDTVIFEDEQYNGYTYTITGDSGGQSGSFVTTPIGDSIELTGSNIYRQAKGCVLRSSDNKITLWQRMTQYGQRAGKEYLFPTFYTNDPRLKVYQEPALTVRNSSLEQAEVFNDGDTLNVHVERVIDFIK